MLVVNKDVNEMSGELKSLSQKLSSHEEKHGVVKIIDTPDFSLTNKELRIQLIRVELLLLKRELAYLGL